MMRSAIRTVAILGVAGLVLAHATSQALPLPPARFEERVSAVFGSDVYLPEHIVIDEQGFHGEATTSGVGAILPGGGPPWAEAVLRGVWGVPFEGSVLARVEYSFGIEGPALPPGVAGVPVIIDAMLLVEADLNGVLGRDVVFASIRVMPPDADSEIVRINGCNNLTPVCSDASASPSFSASMTPDGLPGRIDMWASISYRFPAADWTGHLRAVADPHIYIDPAFTLAYPHSGLRVVISSAVADGPIIPEPSTLLLFGAGLALLVGRRMPRRVPLLATSLLLVLSGLAVPRQASAEPSFEWTLELTSMDLNARGITMPLGPGWAPLLTDIHLRKSAAVNALGKASAQPTLAGGGEYLVSSFFDVLYDIAITDVDPNLSFGGGLKDGQSIVVREIGWVRIQNTYHATIELNAPNFGLILGPQAAPYSSPTPRFGFPLGADLNFNGEDDKIKFALDTLTVGDANRTFISLPDGTVIDTFDATVGLSGAVADLSQDPPFSFELAGPATARSVLLPGVPEPGTWLLLGGGIAALAVRRRTPQR